MGDSGRSPQVTRFGMFELDLQAGELHKHGLKIRLQDQPFKVLTTLLDRPGEVVTREELRKRLWPDDTFVDFDHGLASAINRLREALGDSAESPRYIETLPRRGYRFIAPVDGETPARGAGVEALPEEAPPTRIADRILKSRYTKVAAAGSLAVAAFIVLFLARPQSPPRVLRVVQLTTSGGPSKQSVLATDGLRIYFSREQTDGWSLATMSASGGEPVPISTSVQSPFLEDISPDGTELLVSDRPEFRPEYPLFIVPVVGGSARRVGDIEANCAGWFPNGPKILYAHDGGLYLANPDGSETRRIVTTEPDVVFWPRASPDGKLIRFSQWSPTTYTYSLWEVGADGTGLRPLLPGWSNPSSECCGQWSVDGRYFVFQSSPGGVRNTWVIPEGTGFLRQAQRAPVRLTDGLLATFHPLVSKDNRRVFVIGNQERIEVMRYDARARQFLSFLPEKSVAMLDFTRDGKRLTYISYPEGSLWKSNPDMTESVQLTVPPLQVMLPRWSPDGKLIAFHARVPPGPWKVYLVAAQGGSPQLLAPASSGQQFDPGWSADGNLLVFNQGAEPEDKGGDLRLFDMRARQLSKLSASEGLFSPRWSPDGRYIAALRVKSSDVVIFDLETRTWVELVKGPAGWPCWSRDGKHLYIVGSHDVRDGICRVRISDHKVEKAADFVRFQQPAGSVAWWLGLAPDDSPLMLRDLSVQEIYALDWEAP